MLLGAWVTRRAQLCTWCQDVDPLIHSTGSGLLVPSDARLILAKVARPLPNRRHKEATTVTQAQTLRFRFATINSRRN
ncbi:hypothetical protein RSAG8_01228, partial [Rhizoctonia solani AG-8 WAC10335]